MKNFIKIIILTVCVLVCAIGCVACKNTGEMALNKKAITLTQEKTFQLELENSNDNVVWTSQDENVATVDENGKVTAINVGRTKIFATIGEESYYCIVTVNEYQPDSVLFIDLGIESITVRESESYTLSPVLKQGDTKLQPDSFDYFVSDTSVCVVNSGKITGLKAGQATVTVSTVFDEQTVSKNISVNILENKTILLPRLEKMEALIGSTLPLSVEVIKGQEVLDVSTSQIIYTTSDATIAKIENNNLITLKKGIVALKIEGVVDGVTVSTTYDFRVREQYLVKYVSEGVLHYAEQVLDGEKIVAPTSEPVLNGYGFSGWLNGNEVFDFNSSIEQNLELKPYWVKLNPIVRYDLNEEKPKFDWTGNIGNKAEFDASAKGYNDGNGSMCIISVRSEKYPTTAAQITFADVVFAGHKSVYFYLKATENISYIQFTLDTIVKKYLPENEWTEIKFISKDGDKVDISIGGEIIATNVEWTNLKDKQIRIGNDGEIGNSTKVLLSAIYGDSIDYRKQLNQIASSIPEIEENATAAECNQYADKLQAYLECFENNATSYESDNFTFPQKIQYLQRILN